MQERHVNPNGIPEHTSWEQLPIPNPVRDETFSLLWDTQEIIATTECDIHSYNEATSDFEQGRQNCEWESREARAELMQDIGVTGRLQNRWKEIILGMRYWPDIIEQWFTDTHILWYNNIDWNYVIEISDFENTLQGTLPSEWNSLALMNYFKMLDSKEEFNIWTVIEKLWTTQVIALGDLWRTEPNWPAMSYFQENEALSWIVDGVSQINFENILQTMEREDFRIISELFDAASESDKNIIKEKIHMVLFEVLEAWEEIDFLSRIAWTDNIEWVNQWIFMYTTLKARSMLTVDGTIKAFENMYNDPLDWTWTWPEVSHIFRSILLTAIQWRWFSVDGEIEFNFEWINDIVTQYNTNNNNHYPLVWEEFIWYLEWIFSSNNLNSQYIQALTEMDSVSERIRYLQQELSQDIPDGQREANQIELQNLYRRQFQTSVRAAETQRELENHMLNLDNFNAQIINIDVRNSEHVSFLLNDIQWRVWLIKNIDDFIVFYEQLNHEQQQSIDIDVISGSLLLDERVLRIFIERDSLRDNIIWKLPNQIFKDKWLCELIFKNSRFHYGVLINEIIANNTYDTSLEILRSFLELEDENGEKILSNSENLRYFKMVLNSEIIQELFWDTWDENQNIIQNWESLLENIRKVWTSEMYAGENQWNNWLSLEAPQPVMEESGRWYNKIEHENSIMSYINSHEISSEILQVILERINNDGYTWRLVNFILMRLNTNNTEHVDFAQQIVEANQALYIQLNSAFRIHPDIIQAMSQYDVPTQDTNDTYIFNALIRNIFNAENKYELFALYLQWLPENSIERIRDRRIYEWFIIRFFQERNENGAIMLEWELSDNQSRIIERFLEWDIERQELDRLASTLHQIDESMESDLREILNRNGISVEQREVIVNLVMSGDRSLTFQRALRDALLRWLSNTSESNKLEIAGWIIQNILDLRANTSNQIWQTYRTYLSDWLLNNIQLELMQWNRFLTENGGLNVDLILDDYQEQIQNWIITDSGSDIELFISNLDIPEEIKRVHLDLIKGVINNQNIEWVDIIATARIRQIGDNAEITRIFWESNFDLYWNAREEFRRAVASWELRLSWNFWQNFQEYQEIRNNNQDNRLPENWNTSNLSTDFRERVESSSWGNFLLTTEDGRKIPVTRKDISIIHGSPEAERNLVNAYDIFQNEWLERIWQHKDSLMQAIGSNDTTGMQFNLRDGNYLNERELNYLLSTILYITTENEDYREIWLSLDDTISKVRRETQWAFWEENVRNIGQWENRLENAFINKFTLRNQWDEGRFYFSAFDKALNWDFSSDNSFA